MTQIFFSSCKFKSNTYYFHIPKSLLMNNTKFCKDLTGGPMTKSQKIKEQIAIKYSVVSFYHTCNLLYIGVNPIVSHSNRSVLTLDAYSSVIFLTTPCVKIHSWYLTPFHVKSNISYQNNKAMRDLLINRLF